MMGEKQKSGTHVIVKVVLNGVCDQPAANKWDFFVVVVATNALQLWNRKIRLF